MDDDRLNEAKEMINCYLVELLPDNASQKEINFTLGRLASQMEELGYCDDAAEARRELFNRCSVIRMEGTTVVFFPSLQAMIDQFEKQSLEQVREGKQSRTEHDERMQWLLRINVENLDKMTNGQVRNFPLDEFFFDLPVGIPGARQVVVRAFLAGNSSLMPSFSASEDENAALRNKK